ncbi:MAG: hypothetical protein K9J21_07370 [Bacteroidales bacterium]|nr:hypothetical protein [Bacteroidales bacterium]
MAYGDKYYLKYKDIKGNPLKLVIQKDGYSGATSYLTGSGVPVTLEYSGEDTNKYDRNTFGSRLVAEIWELTQDQYSEFQNADDRQFKFILKGATGSTTKYTGYFEITSLSSTVRHYSYLELDGFITYDNIKITDDYPKVRIKIGGVVKATYSPYTNSNTNISGESVLNTLIGKLNDNDSTFEGEDTSGNDLLDKIIKNDSFVFGSETNFERYNASTSSWNPVYTDFFTPGDTGDTLTLQVDDGVVKNLASITLTSNDTISSIIADCINQINNSGYDYEAELNETNSNKINITYIGSGDANSYTLQYSEDGTWGVNISGMTGTSVSTDTIYWKGYNIAGLSIKSSMTAPNLLSLEATDGLGDLKTREYDAGSGWIKKIKVIASCLQETGLKLPINCMINLYENNMNSTDSDDPLDQAYVKQESVAGLNCREILERLIMPYGAELRQSQGQWWIRKLKDTGSINYRKFGYNGDYISNSSINDQIKIGSVTDYRSGTHGVNLNRDGEIKVEPGIKELIYKQDYGKKDQLLKDPSFTIFNTSGNLIFWNGDTDYSQNDDGLLAFGSIDTKIYQEIDVIKKDVEFSITFSGHIEIKLILNNYYFMTRNGGYEESEEVINIDESEEITISWNLPLSVLEAGTLKVVITAKSSDLVIKEINIDAATGTYVEGLSQKKYDDSVSGYRQEREPFQFYFGDVPSSDWAPYKYLNIITLSAGDTQTSAWGTNSKKLIDITTDEMINELATKSEIIKGTFIFAGFVNAKHIMYNKWSGKYYKLAGGVYNTKKMIFEGKWIETAK